MPAMRSRRPSFRRLPACLRDVKMPRRFLPGRLHDLKTARRFPPGHVHDVNMARRLPPGHLHDVKMSERFPPARVHDLKMERRLPPHRLHDIKMARRFLPRHLHDVKTVRISPYRAEGMQIIPLRSAGCPSTGQTFAGANFRGFRHRSPAAAWLAGPRRCARDCARASGDRGDPEPLATDVSPQCAPRSYSAPATRKDSGPTSRLFRAPSHPISRFDPVPAQARLQTRPTP
jgi:hypothetical protein